MNAGSPCRGVDANRNFPAGWGDSAGASPLPCSESKVIQLAFRTWILLNIVCFLLAYWGTAAFSEKESSALRDLIMADRGRVKIAFSIHSYSQLWMSAYGYKTALPNNYSELVILKFHNQL